MWNSQILSAENCVVAIDQSVHVNFAYLARENWLVCSFLWQIFRFTRVIYCTDDQWIDGL